MHGIDRAAHLVRAGAAAGLRPGRWSGTPWSAALEREYRGYHLQRIRPRVRTWQLLALLLGLASLVRRYVETHGELAGAELALRTLVLLPCCIAVNWAAWSSRYEKLYPRALVWSAPGFYGVTTFLVGRIVGEGRLEAIMFPTISLLAGCFLAGFLFRQAVGVSAIVITGFTLGELACGTPGPTIAYHAGLLLVTGVAGCAVLHAIERANRATFLHQRQVAELATRDGLTGLHNRRAFDEHAHALLAHGAREGRPVAVLLLDVDYFKRYNDRYGHGAGDEVLRRVTRVLEPLSRRPLDLAARYGGEEFALALYDTDGEAATRVAAGICEDVARLGIEHAAAPGGGVVGVSIGVASTSEHASATLERLVRLADAALYRAKHAGRGRVEVARVLSLATPPRSSEPAAGQAGAGRAPASGDHPVAGGEVAVQASVRPRGAKRRRRSTWDASGR